MTSHHHYSQGSFVVEIKNNLFHDGTTAKPNIVCKHTIVCCMTTLFKTQSRFVSVWEYSDCFTNSIIIPLLSKGRHPHSLVGGPCLQTPWCSCDVNNLNTWTQHKHSHVSWWVIFSPCSPILSLLSPHSSPTTQTVFLLLAKTVLVFCLYSWPCHGRPCIIYEIFI